MCNRVMCTVPFFPFSSLLCLLFPTFLEALACLHDGISMITGMQFVDSIMGDLHFCVWNSHGPCWIPEPHCFGDGDIFNLSRAGTCF